jgi:hypothetical protein
MKQLSRWLMVSMACSCAIPTTWAATVIERRDMKGSIEKILLDENQARIESGDPNRYRVMNLQENKTYLIDGKEKRVVAMDIQGTPPSPPANMPKQPDRPPIKSELFKKGEGPKVAGYSTMVYQVILEDGKVCSETFFSKEAGKVAYVQDFLNASNQMQSSRQPKGLPFMHPCQQALQTLEDDTKDLGIPMKAVVKGDRGEKVLYEIVSIKTDVKIPEDSFTLPKDYKVVTESEMMKMRQEQMKQWMEQQRSQRQPERQPEGDDRGPPMSPFGRLPMPFGPGQENSSPPPAERRE